MFCPNLKTCWIMPLLWLNTTSTMLIASLNWISKSWFPISPKGKVLCLLISSKLDTTTYWSIHYVKVSYIWNGWKSESSFSSVWSSIRCLRCYKHSLSYKSMLGLSVLSKTNGMYYAKKCFWISGLRLKNLVFTVKTQQTIPANSTYPNGNLWMEIVSNHMRNFVRLSGPL